MDPPPENDDGRRFRSPNARAEITVSGIFALEDDEETKEEKLADEAKPAIGTATGSSSQEPMVIGFSI